MAVGEVDDGFESPEPRGNALINLALEVVKRDSEKAALLKLKGYDRVDIERNRGKHSVVCRHWLKGMCMKGEFCDFLHQLVYSRMPPCRCFEKNGFCIDLVRGNCIFLHVQSQETSGKEAAAATSVDVSYVADPAAFAASFVTALSTVLPQVYKESTINEDGLYEEILQAKAAADVAEAIEKQEIEDEIVGITIPGLYNASGVDLEVTSRTCKTFIIKCNNMINIFYSICFGVWATGPANTAKFRNAFTQYQHVILIFSGNETGGFQGYARMMTAPIPGLYKGIWGKISNKLGDNFRVKWIKQCSVEFERLRHLTNPLNNNCPLKKSRDGTELPLDVAQVVCTALHAAPSDDLLKGKFKRAPSVGKCYIGTPLYDWDKVDHETYFEELEKKGELNTPVGFKFKPLA